MTSKKELNGQMSFNKNLPHALVYGHEKARYEQNGRLYDKYFKRVDTTLHLPKKDSKIEVSHKE